MADITIALAVGKRWMEHSENAVLVKTPGLRTVTLRIDVDIDTSWNTIPKKRTHNERKAHRRACESRNPAPHQRK